MNRKLTGAGCAALILITCSWCGFSFPAGFPNGMDELGEAQFGMKGHGPKALEAKMCRLLNGVDLTAAQTAELRASYVEVREALAPFKADRENFRAEMQALWTAEELDREAILAAFAEIDPLRAQAFDVLVDYYTYAIGQLTPEQQAEVAAKLATCGEAEEGGESGQRGRGQGGHGSCGGSGDHQSGDGGGGRGGMGGGGRGGMGGGGQNEMGLGFDQMLQIMTLKEALLEEIAPYRDQIKAHKAEMCELWAADPVDADAIKAHFGEIAPVRDEVREIVVSFRIDVVELLTPEQRARMAERISEKGQQDSGADNPCGWLSGDAEGDDTDDSTETPEL